MSQQAYNAQQLAQAQAQCGTPEELAERQSAHERIVAERALAKAAEESTRLRDHFAGLAMQAMLRNSRDAEPDDGSLLATCAYNMADAMLEVREKKP